MRDDEVTLLNLGRDKGTRYAPFGDVVVSLLASIAKLEREKIRERTLAGLARARKAGRVGGRLRAEDDYKLVQGVRKLRGEGKSIRAIANALGMSPTTVLQLSS